MIAGSLGALIGAGAVFWVVALVVGGGTPVIRKLDFSEEQRD
jgi:hypothetical protein